MLAVQGGGPVQLSEEGAGKAQGAVRAGLWSAACDPNPETTKDHAQGDMAIALARFRVGQT
jgi:hypothetical protein